ncbi:MAG: family 20 glycosylhydrolase [Phycisphaerales bacterium]|nr:MAG: family 20 glycosylhydrolase [Phycisphaerales bacterium]
MSTHPVDFRQLLLPRPRHVEALPGVCTVGQGAQVCVDVADSRIDKAVHAWKSGLGDAAETSVGSAGTKIRIAVERGIVRHRDGYHLEIQPNGITLIGGSAAGCFHGLQTLRQSSRSRVRLGEFPCCTVTDGPDFSTRGLLHDVTRGKVPTLSTLKLLVDRLAELKANQLQLYIEHAFAFSFDRDICRPADGLTPDEVRELDAYCRDRFIDLVPALATFGHMGRILSMPRYHHLAEVEAARSWEEMSWPQRTRGLTLDCTDPEARILVSRMWSDILDAFSSPVVNICGDEPWDLGEGKTRASCLSQGKGELYVDHLRRTHELCAARERRTQIWSDVIRGYPQLLDRLPRDLTVLHWGYDDQADYAGTAAFVEAGLDTFVCPGTTGWKRVINALDLAEQNITAFAAAGLERGASGLINTDWGDHGHFNLLACSWHGIALGAALAWDAGHPRGEPFDDLFARAVLRVNDAGIVRALRAASRLGNRIETWPALWMPVAQILENAALPSYEELNESIQATNDARLRLQHELAADDCADLKELSVACAFSELVAEKLLFIRESRSSPEDYSRTHDERIMWANRVVKAGGEYADVWTARNKTSGLDDILCAFSTTAEELRKERP